MEDEEEVMTKFKKQKSFESSFERLTYHGEKNPSCH